MGNSTSSKGINSTGSAGINSTSNAIEVVRGEAECYLLLYESYLLLYDLIVWHPYLFSSISR